MTRSSSAVVQTIMYGVSVLLMRGLSFFMLPYVIHKLSPEEFGLLELLSTMAIVSSVVLSLGLEHALYRFVGQKKIQHERSQVMSHIYSLCVLLCVFVLFINPVLSAAGGDFFVDENIDSIISIVFLSLSFETLVSVPLAWLRMNNRSVEFCIASLLWTALRACFVVVFLGQGYGLISLFLSGLLSTSLIALLLYVLIRQDLHYSIDIKAYSDYLKYGVPIVGSGVLAFFLNGYDRWVLVSYLDAQQIAYYALAAKFALLVSFCMQPYGMWYMPKRFDLLNANNGLQRSRSLSLIGIHLVLWASLAVGLFAPLFVQLFLPPVYLAALPLIPLFVFWACFKEMSEYVNLGCLASKNTGSQLSINLLATVVGVCAMSLMAPAWGGGGVLVGLCVAHYIRFMLFFVISQKRLALNLPITKITCLSIVLLLLLLAHAVHAPAGIVESLVRSTISIGVFAGVSGLLFYRECWHLWVLFALFRRMKEA